MKTRKLLRRILPAGWLPYLLHLRPRAWQIVAAHMSVGFVLANGFDFTGDVLQRWLLAILAWPVLGDAGTLAINSVQEQDEGDIGYLDEPPSPPRYLLRLSLACMVLGLIVATAVGPRFVIAYLICFALSLLYSVPPFRLKARAGFDLLINSTGYSALTLCASWAATARQVEPPIINVVLGFFFLFAGFYPLTQIYQMAEDRRRGDVTLTLRLGKQKTPSFAMVVARIAFAFALGEV